jgi:HSP20 family molecular chaperone IbpA
MREIFDEAAGSPMEPRADVIEDKDAYHFYFEMPGLKCESLDVQVENDELSVAAERSGRSTCLMASSGGCIKTVSSRWRAKAAT